MIVPAREMKETVDEIKGDFICGVEPMEGGLTRGGFKRDEDFPVVKGDDVGGSGVVEKLAVHGGDLGVAQKGDLEIGELGKNILLRACGGETGRVRVLGNQDEAGKVKASGEQRFGSVTDVDLNERGLHEGQAAEADLPVDGCAPWLGRRRLPSP